MTTLKVNQAQLIAFVLQDASGVEVTGLGTTFTVSISKNGGAFAASAGTKAEIGNGWYSYELTAGETDTTGPLALKITGVGVDQQNLLYQISASGWDLPSGTYILSVEEAAAVLRCDTDEDNMLMLLPMVDAYIRQATGRDWAQDDPIDQRAKAAARILLVQWHENPAMIALSGTDLLSHGLRAVLTQLESLALRYKTFQGITGAGAIALKGANVGDTVSSVVGAAGVSGDQSAAFESRITIKDEIQQVSTSDLSDNWYKALLTPVGEDV